MNLTARIVAEVVTEDMNDMTELHPHSELFGKMKVDTENDELMLRTMPRLDSEVICGMPKGSGFECLGLTDSTLKWTLGIYTLPDGKKVAGYANLKYLIKERD